MFFALMLKPVAVEETEEVEQVMTGKQTLCSQFDSRTGWDSQVTSRK